MKHRKLRIGWSVVWGILAVLLVVLWVRSCETSDEIFSPIGKSHVFILGSSRGNLTIRTVNDPKLHSAFGQGFEHHTIDLNRLFGRLPAVRIRDFKFQKLDDGCVVPHCFLILLVSILAAISWLPIWHDRFSLRTLLIAMTIIAVGLGLIAWLR